MAAAKDLKAHAASGRVFVQGNPGADNYWELRTVSGAVQLGVPASANLHLSAEERKEEESGLRRDRFAPIFRSSLKNKGKASSSGPHGQWCGRVDVHTVSGAKFA